MHFLQCIGQQDHLLLVDGHSQYGGDKKIMNICMK
jgi:hypothetical protein